MQEKELLQKAMQQKNMVVLYRDELVAPEYAGVPVAVENELVVLQRQSNFLMDGYCALRTGDITEAEQMDDVPFLRRVMAAEKLYDAVKAPGFPCRDRKELLEGIMAKYAVLPGAHYQGGQPLPDHEAGGRAGQLAGRPAGAAVGRCDTGFLRRPVPGDFPQVLQVRRRRGKSGSRQGARRKGSCPTETGCCLCERDAAGTDFRQAAVCCRKVGIIL